MFVESVSFATSAWTGEAMATAGMVALEDGLAIALAATPAGWVLILGGLAVAGVAAAGSMGVNAYFERHSGSIYDKIMAWVSRL